MTSTDRRTINKIKKMCEERPVEVLRALLETPFWPSILKTGIGYQRYDDDTLLGNIVVVFGPDGDGHIEIVSEKDPDEPGRMHRFRNFFGGGQSLRTYVALLILAVAIDLDNEEKPQQRE